MILEYYHRIIFCIYNYHFIISNITIRTVLTNIYFKTVTNSKYLFIMLTFPF